MWNIYEVNRSDLMQFGNQVGSGNFNLGGSPDFGAQLERCDQFQTNRRRFEQHRRLKPDRPRGCFGDPTMVFNAFQSRNNAKLNRFDPGSCVQ